MKEKYFVRTFGCKTNQYESQLIKELVEKSGNFVSEEYRDADVVVINSCAVTQPAERDVYKFIRRVYRDSKSFKKIILTGCYAEYIKLHNLEEKFFSRLGLNIQVEFLKNNEKYSFIKDLNETQKFITKFFGYKRAYVKIQDGCDNFCSYCIVPYLRKKLYSKPKNVVLKEVESLVNNGYNEIYLVGINIGKYSDFYNDKKYDYIDLSKEILDSFEKVVLIYSSLEVVDLNYKFFYFLEEYKDRIFPHFHIPLQSADDKILASMKRKYSSEFYLDKINKIRKIIPEVIISCDLIVGYPEETKESFLKSLEFIKKVRFSWVHVFPYSPREGTESYKKYGNFVCYDAKQRVREVNILNKSLGEKCFKEICKVQ
ncbi:MAG: MiaB/RimO family radical SAM methylthiotransferase [Endomicrobiia bacterium]